MGEHLLQEIWSQPDVWQAVLNRLQSDGATELANRLASSELLLTGCGSSYYLGLTAAALHSQLAGQRARAVTATDLLTFPETVFAGQAPDLLVAVSRNGQSRETLEAARYVKERLRGKTLAVSCLPESPLPQLCEAALLFPETAEQSRFTTRVFTAMLVAFQYLAASKPEARFLRSELPRLPDVARRLMERYDAALRDFARRASFTRCLFVGHGPYYGLAAESALKTEELARLPAEVYHTLEVMHGPKYAVDAHTLIAVFLSDAAKREELPLLPKMKALGAQIFVICERAEPEVTGSAGCLVELDSGLSEYARLPLVMPVVQLFVHHLAGVRGQELD
jgi:glucosamine--fructose-6-phosphate aminotransferase (isomerizing)